MSGQCSAMFRMLSGKVTIKVLTRLNSPAARTSTASLHKNPHDRQQHGLRQVSKLFCIEMTALKAFANADGVFHCCQCVDLGYVYGHIQAARLFRTIVLVRKVDCSLYFLVHSFFRSSSVECSIEWCAVHLRTEEARCRYGHSSCLLWWNAQTASTI